MNLNELDPYYIKAIGSLHSYDHIISNEPSVLQINLEEAIKAKTGDVKDFGPLIASLNNRLLEERQATTANTEETRTASSSDSDLVEIFNEDLMCIICNGMDVAARNRLLECSECHSLYHQECHQPPVVTGDVDGIWTCQNCKDMSKRMKRARSESSPVHSSSPPAPSKPARHSSPPDVGVTSMNSDQPSLSQPYNASVNVPHNLPKKSSGKSSSNSSKSSNIISADKRLQIMKKKAAKLHEKRKQLSR